MKRIFLIALTLGIAAMPLSAAKIDVQEAQQLVLEFISQMNMEGFSNPNLDGVLTVNSSTDDSQPVLHVYNIYSDAGVGSRFVIVAGENRARRILAYGDEALDISDMPEGLLDLLEFYRQQIESIIVSNPGESVMLNAGWHGDGGSVPSVEPLITTQWGQNTPFNSRCPVYGDSHCSTGCVSTAMSMVINYHGFAQFVEPIPGYTTHKLGLYLDPLDPVDFDWCNMLDEYPEGEYNDDQAIAVAQLMRYTGQASVMDYTTGSSTALVANICSALKRFGYDGELLRRNDYETDAWETILQDELINKRPVIYIANRGESNTGHAFVVDGYDESLNMYHINWGWCGNGDCYCAMDAFSPSTSNSVFNSGQAMVFNIQPAQSTVNVDCESLTFSEYTGYSQSREITVSAMNLTHDVVLIVRDNSSPNASYSVTPDRITPAQAAAGKTVTVTYAPLDGGVSTARIVLYCDGVEAASVNLQGFATRSNGMITNYQPVYEITEQLNAEQNGIQRTNIIMIPFTWHMQYFNPLSPVVSSAGPSIAQDLDIENLSQNMVFSYDLQGDSAYRLGMELMTLNAQEGTLQPASGFNLDDCDEFVIQIFYRFTTLGKHNATLTITHPTLTVKPVVIELRGNAVWPLNAPYLYGDVNGDGLVDVSDVAILIAYVLGKDVAVNEQAADVNGDGLVDISDVAILLRYIIGD